ncbi:MAG: acyl carrier protein [Kiritimatiellae bacterium]|nr:acyl carrier protein [Kiritimatiellia bacterium]MBR4946684.1 acyl carrier protein [Kiritimatiellia bacterium]MBR5587679.1 acyl carrier protein [Kiritimatiellia bacterium]
MHTYDEIFNTIKSILIEEFECDEALVTPDVNLFETLDLDSIDAVDLIVRLQNMTQLKVKAEDFRQIRTLDDVVKVIQRLIAEQAPTA